MRKHDSKNPSSGVRPGFTLVEMLVVITIIAVLFTISLIGMQRMRAMADKVNSTRNIAQIQFANTSYATDHNGNFVKLKLQDGSGPVTDRWFQDITFVTYLTGMSAEEVERNNPTAIPLGLLDPKVVRARKPLYNRVYTSYGMNETGLMGRTENSPRNHHMNQISNFARSMAFATATDFRVSYNSRYRWDFENPNDSKTGAGEIAYRHADKVLVVYFDGHVGEMSKADLEAIDKRGGRNNPFWNPKAK